MRKVKLLSMLEEILNSKPKVKVLQLIINKQEWIFGESEISRDLNVPKATIHRSLKKLRDQNIIREFKKGRGIVYQLNKTNFIVKELLEPMFKKESEIVLKKSKEFCENFSKLIRVAIVFGSAARGEMRPTSDVDLAIVANESKKLQSSIAELKIKYLEEDSIIFSTHIFSLKDFENRYERKDPLILEIANGIVIYGSLEDVIYG